jgi:hypothetical protein
MPNILANKSVEDLLSYCKTGAELDGNILLDPLVRPLKCVWFIYGKLLMDFFTLMSFVG